jgi:dethiobiotin synthetase
VKALFVTGTDTGVGKTTMACALVSAFVRRGLTVAAMKPCETGDGDDAARLAEATGRALDLSLVSPYRFALPASPAAAAAAVGRTVDLEVIASAFQLLVAGCDLAIVEGAGGLLVPLDDTRTMADLARRLALSLVVVARPSLGTVNHTLLTVEAARRRDLTVAGVVFSRVAPPRGPDERSNPEAIARHGRVAIFGTLPQLHPGDDAAALAEQHLDLDGLWRALPNYPATQQ